MKSVKLALRVNHNIPNDCKEMVWYVSCFRIHKYEVAYQFYFSINIKEMSINSITAAPHRDVYCTVKVQILNFHYTFRNQYIQYCTIHFYAHPGWILMLEKWISLKYKIHGHNIQLCTIFNLHKSVQ